MTKKEEEISVLEQEIIDNNKKVIVLEEEFKCIGNLIEKILLESPDIKIRKIMGNLARALKENSYRNINDLYFRAQVP